MEGLMMARFIRHAENIPTATTSATNGQEPRYKIQESHEETWPQYITRGAIKTPVNIYENIRTLGGIGDLISRGLQGSIEQPIQEETDFARKMQEYIQNYSKGLQVAYSGETARQEAKGMLRPFIGEEKARYATESRPGDWPMELLSLSVPSLIGTGLSSGISGLAKQIPQEAGMLAGGYAGGELGRSVGGTPGALIGTVIGATAGAHPLKTFAPSKTLGREIETAQHAAWEKERLGKLQTAEKEFEEIQSALYKTQTALERSKKSEIVKINKEIGGYSENIKKISKAQNEYYKQAQKLETIKSGDASRINKILEKTEVTAAKALKPADRTAIADDLVRVGSSIRDGKMTVEDAKMHKKNLNFYLFGRDATPAYREQIKPIIESLEKFIENSGTQEHKKAWIKAENATRKKWNLIDKESEFLADKKAQIREIKAQRVSPEEKRLLRQEAMKKNEILKGIKSETYENAMKTMHPESGIMDKLDKMLNHSGKFGLGSLILGSGFGYNTTGVIGALAGTAIKGYKEAKFIKNALKSHPEIVKEYYSLLAKGTVNNIPRLAARFNKLGEKLENYTTEEQQKEPESSTNRKGGRFIRNP